MRSPISLVAALFVSVVLALVAGACSNDGEADEADGTTTTVPPSTTATAAPEAATEPEEPSGAVLDALPAQPESALSEGPDGGVVFSCDFATACPLDQFVQFRDSWVVSYLTGEADHGIADGATIDHPVCTAPEETRTWQREHPYQLSYRCLPGGDPELAHQMSVVPDTSGYTWTGAAPDQVFEDVRRVSFTVNMTAAGIRNFWELSVIPADEAWVDAMPCIPVLPCNDRYDYDDIGAIGFGNNDADGSGFTIATPSRPNGHQYDLFNASADAAGDIVFAECAPSADICFSAAIQWDQVEVRPRFPVVIEDRDDGLWFGQEDLDGTFYWVTLPGQHLPDGPVRVVLKFHGYTPTKEGNGPGFAGNVSASEGGFTWHWDDLVVEAGSAVPSMEYYGGVDPERFVTSAVPGCIAFAQGQRDEQNRTISPVISCPAELSGLHDAPYTYGAVPGAEVVG